ncbi:MAG: DUF4132 domain-containing protein [Planctomycetota bacterium]
MDSRNLVFSEGSSDKFWNIELEDCSHTVNYGRVGTNGQTKTKEFGSEEEARKSYDKLVEQKLKKGYEDAAGSSSPAKKKVTPKKKSATTSNTTSSKKDSATTKKATTKKAATKKSAPEKASPSKETQPAGEPAIVADLRVTSELGLEPQDYYAASFEHHEVLKIGKASEADVEAQVELLSKMRPDNYGWDLKFESLDLQPPLPKEEAHFWFVAMTTKRKRLGNQKEVQQFAKKLASSEKFTGKISFAKAAETVSTCEGGVPEAFMNTLTGLFDTESIIKIVLKACTSNRKRNYDLSHLTVSLCQSFRKHVVPYIPKKQIPALKKLVLKTLDVSYEPPDSYSSFNPEHYLAAALGMHKEIRQFVANWPDDKYTSDEEWASHYQSPESILCGLGSAEEVEAEYRRLKIKIREPEEGKVLLACTGFNCLDILGDQICKLSNREDAAKLMNVLAAVRAPEAAEPILQCRLESKAPAIARDWLDANVGNAVAGLLETAAGKGKLADAAVEYLRGVKRNGHLDLITKQLGKLKKKPAVTEKVTREVIDHVEKIYEPLTDKNTPKWLKTALEANTATKKPKLPSWADVTQLPSLIVEDTKKTECRLNDEQLQSVVESLACTDITEKHPLLVALKENVTRTSLDAFAWRMFETWQEDGSVSKNKWAMGAIGHLGDDECVMKLTPMVRVWPGESQHARAVFGLQCLRGVGTSTALMQLSGIAQKLKFKGLKTKAAAFVEEIAKEKGMTRAELEDRVVPDCGLDEHGKREFSFGDRSFSFVLGGDLKPMVRDEAGEVRPNPPKPAAKDNQEIAEASLAEWKLIKKQIKEVATLQAGRLEQGMVTGRRWPLADFESLLVKHPLVTHLVQKLIWGAFDAKGKHKLCFRVTEEKDFADNNDEAVEIASNYQIGLMHPLELKEAEKGKWGEVMSDYELIAPFPQLGREVYSIDKLNKSAKEVPGFDGISLSAPTMVFTLEKLGWVRGEAMDGGCFDEHSKQFPSADVTAVIHYEGVAGMGYIDPDETLDVKSVLFCKGMREPSGYGWGNKKICFVKDVSPIVLSEVLADLHVLQSKVK